MRQQKLDQRRGRRNQQGGHRGRRCGGALGAGGDCICPKCGTRTAHQAGVPCIDERCSECGSALLREGSPHHQQVMERRQWRREDAGR
jgi:hypothetical protein